MTNRPEPMSPRWLRSCGWGVLAFAALVAPFAWREAGKPMMVGGLDLGGTTGYLWALAWAGALALVLAVLPLRRLEKRTLLVLWGAKVAVALGFMLLYEARYRSGLDAFWYYYHGVPNYVPRPIEPFGGVNNVYALVWWLHGVVPDSYQAFKVTFAFLGLIAIYLFYRAARVAWPSFGPRTLAFLGLFPSVLFFSSILGKDPLVLLGIGAATLGLALLWRRSWWGPLWLVAGLLAVQLVRPWIVPILALPAVLVALASLVPVRTPEVRAKVLAATLGVLAIGIAAAALVLSDSAVVQGALQEVDEQSRAWAEGGTGQTPPRFDEVWVVLAFLPWGMFTALFRPLPGDGGGLFGLLAGLESVALLAFIALVALDLRARGTGRRFAEAPVLWATLAILLWSAAYAFVSYQNLGTGFRFRLQVLPILLLLLVGLTHIEQPVRRRADGLRILALTPTYRPLVGGAETALHELFVRLAGAGHEVHVVTPRHAGPVEETVTPGLHVHRVGRSVHSRPAKFLLYQWWALRRLGRLHEERPFHVALLAYGVHASLVQPWLQLRMPVVIEEIHLGTGAEVSTASENPRVLVPLLRRSYRAADAVVVQSRDTGAFVQLMSGRADWTLIPQGTDPDRFHPRRRSADVRRKHGDPQHLLVTASRLSPRKNLRAMLQAFASLRPGRDVRLVIAGDGPDRPMLQEEARRLGIAERVDFPGFLTDDELPDLLASCDLFLSTATYEAFGLSIVDAMASGLPVVAFDARGPNDYLKDGVAGRVLPHDAQAMAHAIDTLLDDPARLRAMGAAARAAILAGYTWDSNASRHADLLRAVADGGGARLQAPLLLMVSNDRAAFQARLPLVDAARAGGWRVEAVLPPGPEVPGLTVHAWPLDRRGRNPLREAGAVRRLTRLYRSIRPDLVHHFTIKPVAYGGLAAARAGVPAVHSITGLGYAFLGGWRRAPLRWTVRLLLRRSLRTARHVLFQNRDDLALFADSGLLRGVPASVVPGSGIDLERFPPTALPAGAPVAAFLGRYLADKGVREFVAAARLLRQRGVDVRCVLVGAPDPGNPASVAPAEVAAWVAEGAVQDWGWSTDVPATLAKVAIACLPSEREGVPRALLEAAAMGRPVVTTDAPGCRDAVDPGRTGLLVPPRDPDALADAIARLATDADLRRTLGAAGRAFVERGFGARRVHEQVLAVYEAARTTSMRLAFLPDRDASSPVARLRVHAVAAELARRGHDTVVLPNHVPTRAAVPRTAAGVLRTHAAFARATARLRAGDVLYVARVQDIPGLGRRCIALARHRGLRLVFDFDDAVQLRHPRTTAALVRAAHLVVAASDDLAAYARSLGAHCLVVPTAIDPADYPAADFAGPPVIGWMGTPSNLPFLAEVQEPVAAAMRRTGAALHVVCDEASARRHAWPPGTRLVPWALERYRADMAAFHVALAPVPDTPWTRGKLGLKVIEYMACGVPCVLSPLMGRRDTAAAHGAGLVAAIPAEWEEHIVRLVQDDVLRRAMGQRGRQAAQAFALPTIVDQLEPALLALRHA